MNTSLSKREVNRQRRLERVAIGSKAANPKIVTAQPIISGYPRDMGDDWP